MLVTHHCISFEGLDLRGLKNIGKETEKTATRRRKKVVNAILELGN